LSDRGLRSPAYARGRSPRPLPSSPPCSRRCRAGGTSISPATIDQIWSCPTGRRRTCRAMLRDDPRCLAPPGGRRRASPRCALTSWAWPP